MSASTKKKLRKEQNAAQLTEKQLAAQKEAKKLKSYTLIFVIVVAAVLCLAIVIMAVTAFTNSGILERNTDALTVGEHTLSNAELNYYYIDTVNEYYTSMTESYGDYASMYMQMMGLDITLPLNEQPYDDDSTFADYFAELAITNANDILAIYDQAVAANHTMTEEEQESLEATFSTMELYSTMYGYTSVEEYLKAVYGPGSQEETYRAYMEVQNLAQSYQAAKYDSLTYDEAAISAYNDEHFDDFSSFDYSVFTAYTSDFLACTADADDEEHEHTVEEEAAAEAAAKEAMESVAASGVTTPVALNKALSALEAYAEKESVACTENDDVLFSEITNEETAAWLADDARKAGDITVIPYQNTSTDADGNETTSVYGYFIVLFEGRNNNEMNLVNVRHILTQFDGGTSDSTTGTVVYSDEEKAAALETITAVQEQWLADGGSEEAFEALVADNSDDTGSSSNGGLYEDVYPGQMVDAFNDWCFDESRQAGDYEIVETEYGYHLIYFVSTDEVTFRNYMIENTLRNTDYEAWYNETAASVETTELNTKYLARDLVLGS